MQVGQGASVSNAKALQGSQFITYLFQGETLPQVFLHHWAPPHASTSLTMH